MMITEVWKEIANVARSEPNGSGCYPNGLKKYSGVQEYATGVLIDLECRAETMREDADSEYGQLYYNRREYYMKTWKCRN